jgi:carbon monoxide dehydrogenase subunit G
MATYTSKININRSLTDIYQFLADFNNHQQLMPDNVQNWASTYNEASFGIQNMVQLSLQITERIENKSIKILAINGPPFPVQLSWELSGDDAQTAAAFIINAELNMMMKMMASGPLQKLTEHETQRLAAILG